MDQQTLKKMLSYDESTGNFTWVAPLSRRVRVGDVAGSKRKDGYIEIRVCGELILAHRLVWLYVRGHLPPIVMDHINGVRDDNRLCNLREATARENACNIKMHSDNRSGYKGVFWCKRSGKWIAKICHKGKQKWIGSFSSPAEAHHAYVEASKIYHKDFARSA